MSDFGVLGPHYTVVFTYPVCLGYTKFVNAWFFFINYPYPTACYLKRKYIHLSTPARGKGHVYRLPLPYPAPLEGLEGSNMQEIIMPYETLPADPLKGPA